MNKALFEQCEAAENVAVSGSEKFSCFLTVELKLLCTSKN